MVTRFEPLMETTLNTSPFGRADSGQRWDDPQLTDDLAHAAGLQGKDLQVFQSCFAGHATSRFVLDTQQNKPDTIAYTPAFTVNGNQADLRAAAASPAALLTAIQQAA